MLKANQHRAVVFFRFQSLDANSPSGTRKLDDSELDSGNDEGRQDRLAETIEDGEDNDDMVRVQHRILEAEVGRIQAPEAGEDGVCDPAFALVRRTNARQLYILNMPPFLGIESQNYDPDTYAIPTAHHSGVEANEKFSPFNVANTTIFWRHDPQNPSKLQSNARIIRWSDGSLTLQMASSPKDQYRISTTALKQSFGKKQKSTVTHDYDPDRDAQVYLAAPHASTQILQIVSPISAAMKILPTGEQTDESVLKLQKSLAAAGDTHDPFAAIKIIQEDPELARKRAELAEKDMQRAKRKTELLAEKDLDKKKRVLGRSGYSRGVGLSVAGLEDEDGMPGARGKAKSKRKINRRGDIYSDDEDDRYPRGRTKEDEYDLEDDFMAASDEEPETFEDGEGEEDNPDLDDLEIEGTQTVVQNRTRGERQSTPKRSTAPVEDEELLVGSPHARKKRRVIDDDDEDE